MGPTWRGGARGRGRNTKVLSSFMLTVLIAVPVSIITMKIHPKYKTSTSDT